MLNFIYWNPSPDFVTIGTFSIKWYGVFWGMSLMSCFFIGRYVFKKLNWDDEKITLIIQYMFVGGLIGARLAHIVFYQLDFYMAHPEDLIAVWKGGLASHGGFVGAAIGLWLFCYYHKEFNFFRLLDVGAVCVISLAALIRLGNLMNSELYGKETSVPWAFVFEQIDNVPRHAVVLYESVAYFILQIIILLLFNRYKLSKPGIYLAFFFTTVFGVRFLLEFFKVPDGEMIGFISKTQLLNLPFIITGLAIAYLSANGKLKYGNA